MQRSFDDLGAPLATVTFVVVDLETTGGSAETCAITEVGAIKLRGGECLGTFQTLVNPGLAIPPAITYLTGITNSMVLPAPEMAAVLPALLEFIGGAVIVGHNIRFDLSFLRAAADRLGFPRLTNRAVDTCALARRLVADEVSDCKLSTLAEFFRTARKPTHRALDDAVATGEVLHRLLERAGSLGVLALDDLMELPTVRGHPQVAKLKLTNALPRRPGVYLFRDPGDRVLYVGKAVDLRRRVRSYFAGGGDDRRKVGPLLRELARIDHQVCSSELEASVLEIRLIHELTPRYNRQAKLWRRYVYLKLTLDERFPRLSVVRTSRPGDGCLYLGPLGSSRAAHLVAEAIESALPLRRCRHRPGRVPRDGLCTPAQLGASTCPCAGQVDEEEYGRIVADAVDGLTRRPELLLLPLADKMASLAAAQRFEEAADVRDRASALTRALDRQRRFDALRRAGRITVSVPGEGGALLDRGRLVAAWAEGHPPSTPPLPLPLPEPVCGDGPGDLDDGPLPLALADEVACVARWLEDRADRLSLIDGGAGLSWPLPGLPRFEPGQASWWGAARSRSPRRRRDAVA